MTYEWKSMDTTGNQPVVKKSKPKPYEPHEDIQGTLK